MLELVTEKPNKTMKTEPVSISIVLSDHVICEQGTRKNSLIGCFHNFNSPRFPFLTPPFFITSAITNLDTDLKEFSLCVRIEDPKDGAILTSVSGGIKLAEQLSWTKDFVFEFPIPIMPFVIPHAGVYKIDVRVNNEPAGHRFLLVIAITAPSAPPQ
jgi:Family of unknown function (DUF6941)